MVSVDRCEVPVRHARRSGACLWLLSVTWSELPADALTTATEPGIKYTCDACHVDITHTVRIKCAAKECDEIDLCVSCFLEGKEIQKHQAWHPYKVVVSTHPVALLTPGTTLSADIHARLGSR